jgi:hypothetical protein
LITRLPFIGANVPVTAEGVLLSPLAHDFAKLWLQRLGARANVMRVDNRLVLAAQFHAIYLASRQGNELLQSMHVGMNGSYSNDRVLDAGYRLPREYKRGHNNVESCARDAGGPQATLDGLLASPAHHDHLMGVNGFSDRVVWGVGQAGDDYVVLICPEEVA